MHVFVNSSIQICKPEIYAVEIYKKNIYKFPIGIFKSKFSSEDEGAQPATPNEEDDSREKDNKPPEDKKPDGQGDGNQKLTDPTLIIVASILA